LFSLPAISSAVFRNKSSKKVFQRPTEETKRDEERSRDEEREAEMKREKQR